MGLRCEDCGKKLKDRKDRFCPYHAAVVRTAMAKSGYLTAVPMQTRKSDKPYVKGQNA